MCRLRESNADFEVCLGSLSTCRRHPLFNFSCFILMVCCLLPEFIGFPLYTFFCLFMKTSQFHWMQHNTKAWWLTVGQLFYTWNSLPFLLQAGLGEGLTLPSCTIPPAFPSDDWKQALVLTGKLRSDTSVNATVITMLIISCYWTDISFKLQTEFWLLFAAMYITIKIFINIVSMSYFSAFFSCLASYEI